MYGPGLPKQCIQCGITTIESEAHILQHSYDVNETGILSFGKEGYAIQQEPITRSLQLS